MAFRLQIPIPANPAPSSINDAGSGTPLPGTTADTRLPTHWVLSLLKQIFRSTALALNEPAPVLVNVNVTPVELYDVEPEKQVPNEVPLAVEQPTACRLLNVPPMPLSELKVAPVLTLAVVPRVAVP